MAKIYGKTLTAVLSGAADALAPGSSVNAGMRVHREVFDLASPDASAADILVLAKPRNGDVILGFKLSSSVDLSAMTIKIGTAADDDYYMTAVAGPATPGVTKEVGLTSGIDDGPLPSAVEILGVLGGTVPAAGILVVQTIVSHR